MLVVDTIAAYIVNALQQVLQPNYKLKTIIIRCGSYEKVFEEKGLDSATNVMTNRRVSALYTNSLIKNHMKITEHYKQFTAICCMIKHPYEVV